jgi:hypothetical protein
VNASSGASTQTEANAETLRRATVAAPVLVDILPAGEVIPALDGTQLLHAGPPLDGWDEACGPLRGAVVGTLVHLGVSRSPQEAESMAESDRVRLVSAADYNALGTFAGVIARQTPVFVVEDRSSGLRTFSAINEGRGKAMRYGSHDPQTLERLSWLEGRFAEILATGIRNAGGIPLFEVLVQALHMGDDGHSRQKAASALFANLVAPHLVGTGFDSKEIARVLEFLTRTEIFFLPLAMAAAKAAMLAAEGIPGSTIVTSMAGNGVRWGIRVSGCGPRWFTAPVPPIQGRFFEGYDAQHAGPVIGDSEIAETMGLGAFAMAAAPALAAYVGGTPDRAKEFTMEMYRITAGEHPRFTIPYLGYRGTPFGIDVRRVVETGIEPVFNTGIAHREAGVGQIGAGFGRTPLACCIAALRAVGA